ncbi:MAG: SDR family oxidoreductase [Gammaproteobacteria bacterium]|nr:MAG: SDR family oxidoreductase [Gammaproteobacteria bacterium]
MAKASKQRVFITGAASGLGRALALAFGRAGARVAVADVNTDRADDTTADVADAGGEAISIHCDITDDDQVSAAAEAVRKAWGGIDVVINNAGVAAAGTVADTTIKDWGWIIDINLLGAVRVCRTFLPMMQEAGSGHIVNVASVAGVVQSPGMASYNVTKAGMIALSETLRGEMAGHGIGVSVVCPSFFTTNLLESYRGPKPGVQLADKLMTRSSLTADDIAAAVIRAIDKNEFFVFGHREASVAYHFKRLLPGMFYWSTERAGRKLFGDIVDLGDGDR